MENETPKIESIESQIIKKQKKEIVSVPVAIIIAGVFIAIALYLGLTSENKKNVDSQILAEPSLDNMRELTKRDHTRGDINAPVKIIEYSDTECPFCKKFHESMKRIIDEHGASGEVVWIYRHSPLYKPNAAGQTLHSKAITEAQAQECAWEQGGDEKFWAYTDRIYEITPSNNQLDLAELPKIAASIGLDVKKFNDCLASNKYKDYVDADLQNAYDTGGGGTPWNIVITRDGTRYPLSGAQPYEVLKQVVEFGLK